MRYILLIVLLVAAGCQKREGSRQSPSSTEERSSSTEDESEKQPTKLHELIPPGPPPITGACEVVRAQDLAGKGGDPIAEFSPFFLVEQHSVIFRLPRPDSDIAKLEESLSELSPEVFKFVPCGEFVLLWRRDETQLSCADSTAHEWLRERVGAFEVLHCFEYTYDQLSEDCLKGRLPLDRCRDYHRPLYEQENCGMKSLPERRLHNELAIKLGFADPGSKICLE